MNTTIFEVTVTAKMDLTGQRFGRLVVLEEAEHYRHGWNTHRQWLCQCDCGNRKVVLQDSLVSGRTKSCGCIRQEKSGERLREVQSRKEGMDLTGQRFGHLLVIKEAERHIAKDGKKLRQWLCQCELCGKEKLILQPNLTRGRTKSCGCKQHRKCLVGEWSNPRWWLEHYEGWVGDCPYCGRVNPLPSNYCNGCGARLEAKLPE